METVRVLAKGQVVIPASVRRKYDIHPGFGMYIFEYGDLICLVPPSKDPIYEKG